ncbi:MAG: Hpt domain-containing protein [Treponema sp.]|jgi:HPt (histidine-containing phosphotransfer) domain-containing protein|nr:Hpt domain-containing protein [Treponema sp.]
MADEKIYVDFDEGIKRVMDNVKLYIKLLEKFKTDTNFADLSGHLSAGDLEKARVSAHTLKGLAANLSLTELFERTRELEGQIKEGGVREGVLDMLKSVYEETIKKIDEVIAKHAS